MGSPFGLVIVKHTVWIYVPPPSKYALSSNKHNRPNQIPYNGGVQIGVTKRLYNLLEDLILFLI